MVKAAPSKKTTQPLEGSVPEDKKENAEEDTSKSRKAMPAVLRVLIAILVLVFFAAIFTWYILWQQYSRDADAVWNFIQYKPVLAGYSYTVILLVMCAIAAVTWRPFLTVGISFVLCSILMYINTQKFNYRDAPLLPEDFLMADQAGTIAQFIDPWSITRLVIGVLLILAGSVILECGARKVFGPHTKNAEWWERHSILPRAAWTMVALTGLLMFSRPVIHYEDDNERGNSEWITDLKFKHWNQKDDFADNGFIIAFLYNLGRFQESEPDDYSEAAIAKIAEQYTDQSENKKVSLDQVADNIIVVLDESFIDPEILGERYKHTGGDVVPNLHKIFSKYPSGYMYSPGYGGGTANIEFEVLTGLSNYWAQTTPYVTSLSKLNNIPGLVGNAASDGFSGTAIHPYDGSMYKRSAVYGRMGFDNFIDEKTIQYSEHEANGVYISDRETYREALSVLKNGDDKHMVMIATMQNHMPYDTARYERRNFKLLNVTASAQMFEAYLETVHHADQYLGEFVAELDKLEEKTVMVWFGDHAPALLSEYVDSNSPELIDLAHLTPYFIYANFDLNELYTEKEVEKMNLARGFEIDAAGVDLPVVTPNCLMNTLYQLLDVEMPPLVYLTNQVCEESPILAPTYSRNNKIEEKGVLKDYRLINYDILSGKKYWLKI